MTQGFQQPWERYRLFGTLTYANAVSTPLQGFRLDAQAAGGMLATTRYTDAQGRYYLYGLNPGSYSFGVESAMLPGSINATDALLVMKHFALYTQLTGIYLKAADVNASGAVNAADALDICRFFVDSIPALPAGSWLVSQDTVSLGLATLNHDLQAICYGDVNASFIPPGYPKQSVVLEEEGMMYLPGGRDVLIPLRIREALPLGAMSMVIQAQAGVVEFTGVTLPSGKGSLQWKADGHSLRMTWFGDQAMEAGEDGVLFWIRARLLDLNSYLEHGIRLEAGVESEMAGPDAVPYESVQLFVPRLQPDIVPSTLLVGDIYPNPATDRLWLRLALPFASQLTLTVLDVGGRQVRATRTGRLEEGAREVELDLTGLATGPYLLRIELMGQAGMGALKKFVVMP